MSFDVQSLFPSIPLDLAIDCVKEAIEEDNDIVQRTLLQKEDILHLTKVCLQSTYFQYNN